VKSASPLATEQQNQIHTSWNVMRLFVIHVITWITKRRITFQVCASYIEPVHVMLSNACTILVQSESQSRAWVLIPAVGAAVCQGVLSHNTHSTQACTRSNEQNMALYCGKTL
jgi:hypothetical protein